jgi:hypothetical protein
MLGLLSVAPLRTPTARSALELATPAARATASAYNRLVPTSAHPTGSRRTQSGAAFAGANLVTLKGLRAAGSTRVPLRSWRGRGVNHPGRRELACRGRYFFLRCHFLTCAALLWNFFAVAVLHAPTESPCR